MKKITIISIVSLFMATAILLAGGGDEWASMKAPRSGASAVVYDGRIYVFGGKSIHNNVLNTVEVYDNANNSWDAETVPSFKNARYDAAAMLWHDLIVLIGGVSWNNKVLKNIEIYDPAQNKWLDAHNLHKERAGHTAVELGGHMFVIGGRKQNGDYIDDVEWYDEQDGEFEEADFRMVSPRAGHFAAVVDDVYYMFGGVAFGGAQKTGWKAVREYGTTADDGEKIIYKWYPLPELPVARYSGATAVAHDSLIYLIGGTDGNKRMDRIEIFNTKTEKFVGTEFLDFGRSGMASATINENIFLIGGHGDGWMPIDDVYLLHDPGTAVQEFASDFTAEKITATAYPNPFRDQVSIETFIPLNGMYQITIFNLLGQKIRSLANDRMIPGRRTILWDAKDEYGRLVVAGAYFVTIRNQTQQKLVKLIHVK